MNKKILPLLSICLFQFLTANETLHSSTISAQQSVIKFEINKMLESAFPDLKSEQYSIKELQGGLSGVGLYKIEASKNSYVLRVYKSKTLTDQDAIELSILTKAAKKGISPTVLHASSENKFVLMEFIDGKTINIEQANIQENIARLAEAIRKTHQIESDQSIKGESLVSKAERCSKVLLKANLIPQEIVLHTLELIKEYSFELSKYSYTNVLIHGDLNPRNIFLTPEKVLFIDWAETGLDDPFYDLSYLSLKLNYDEKNSMLLIEEYLQRKPSCEEKERFKLQKKILHAFWSLTDLYLTKRELEKNPSQTINTYTSPKEWGIYQRKFAECCENLDAQYFYELSRLNYQLAQKMPGDN